MFGILAGIMIGIGCLLYLQVGGVAGACLFSVGLMSVCLFQMKLFTGQAGKIAERTLSIGQLLLIWGENFIGILLVVLITMVHPNYQAIAEGARNIMMSREQVGFFGSFILSIPCGLLMYCAVNAKSAMRLFYIMICVSAFILGGFYHCVADLFYTWLGANNWHQIFNIVFNTLGEFRVCNFIHVSRIIANRKNRGSKNN